MELLSRYFIIWTVYESKGYDIIYVISREK